MIGLYWPALMFWNPFAIVRCYSRDYIWIDNSVTMMCVPEFFFFAVLTRIKHGTAVWLVCLGCGAAAETR